MVPSCEALNVSNDEKASKDTPFEPNKPNSPLALDYLFSDLDIPFVEDNTTPPIPKAPSSPRVDTFWDPSPPSSKHDPYSPIASNIHICTFHTNDDIPSNFSNCQVGTSMDHQ